MLGLTLQEYIACYFSDMKVILTSLTLSTKTNIYDTYFCNKCYLLRVSFLPFFLFLFFGTHKVMAVYQKMWLPKNSFTVATTSFPWSFLHSTGCITIEITPVIQFVCIWVIAQLAEVCSVSVMSYFEEKKSVTILVYSQFVMG